MYPAVKVVAHRGESLLAPENTLEAFALAWVRGARAIEADFHLSKDGEVICMHDDNALRTCGVDRALADMTLAEIRTLNAGRIKGPEWSFCTVPTLREVLETLPAYGEIFIELKCAGPVVDAVAKVLAAGPWRSEQVTFIAFNEAVIAQVKRALPAHQAYWLTGNIDTSPDGSRSPRNTPDQLAARIRELGVDGVDVCATGFVSQAYVDAVHEAGFSFHIWTVDDPAAALLLAELGVDSITTNCARRIQMQLDPASLGR